MSSKQRREEEKHNSSKATVTSLPSFSKDLWHAFEPIVERLEQGNRSLDEYLVFMRERILCEQNYARSLEKVCKRPCGNSEEGDTLKMALESIRGDLSNEHAQRVEFANSLILEVYDPGLTMKSLYSKMNRKFIRDGRRAIKDFKNAQARFKKTRIRHEKVTEELVQAKDAFLGAQGTPNDTNSKEIIKLASRVNVATKSEIESRDRFEQAKREIQQEYQRYFDTLSSILAGMQSNEEARITYMRGALTKLVIFDTSLIRNRQYDTDGMAAIMENISQLDDLSKFIEATLAKHPYPSPAPPSARRPSESTHQSRVGKLAASFHRRYNSEPAPQSRGERRGSVDSTASDSSVESNASESSNISSASLPQPRIAPLPQPSADDTPSTSNTTSSSSSSAQSENLDVPKTPPHSSRKQTQFSPDAPTSPALPTSFPLPNLQPPLASKSNGFKQAILGARRSPSLPSRTSRTLPNGVGISGLGKFKRSSGSNNSSSSGGSSGGGPTTSSSSSNKSNGSSRGTSNGSDGVPSDDAIAPPSKLSTPDSPSRRFKSWIDAQQNRLKEQNLTDSPLARNFRQLKKAQFLTKNRNYTWPKTSTTKDQQQTQSKDFQD